MCGTATAGTLEDMEFTSIVTVIATVIATAIGVMLIVTLAIAPNLLDLWEDRGSDCTPNALL